MTTRSFEVLPFFFVKLKIQILEIIVKKSENFVVVYFLKENQSEKFHFINKNSNFRAQRWASLKLLRLGIIKNRATYIWLE